MRIHFRGRNHGWHPPNSRCDACTSHSFCRRRWLPHFLAEFVGHVRRGVSSTSFWWRRWMEQSRSEGMPCRVGRQRPESRCDVARPRTSPCTYRRCQMPPSFAAVDYPRRIASSSWHTCMFSSATSRASMTGSQFCWRFWSLPPGRGCPLPGMVSTAARPWPKPLSPWPQSFPDLPMNLMLFSLHAGIQRFGENPAWVNGVGVLHFPATMILGMAW